MSSGIKNSKKILHNIWIVNTVNYLCNIMVYKRKSEEQQEDLKVSILEAAQKLFLDQGFEHTSMRKIAARVGISATTIYLYYRDKAEIMHALHQEGFKMLNEQFKTLHYVEDPFERLKSMGRCYIHFAIENRDYYEIMFSMEKPLEHLMNPAECELGWPEGESAFHNLLGTIDACQDQGHFENYDPYDLAILIWSTVHGLCTLNNSCRLELIARKSELNPDIKVVVNRTFDTLVKMLESI